MRCFGTNYTQREYVYFKNEWGKKRVEGGLDVLENKTIHAESRTNPILVKERREK